MSEKPRWYQQAIFYELYVRAFCDANGDGRGDFEGLIRKLDYVQELGIDCVWLLPIYDSPLRDDGYDVSDYYGFHPDYGTEQDFQSVLDEAHRRGLRVITDLVVNHTSDQHPWFQASRSSKNSAYRDYYVWSPTDQRYLDARIIFLDTEKSNWTFDPTTKEYYWHRFYHHQPDLNYDNPQVQQAMLDVMDYWLGKGIDGFRADAVPYLFEREGTSCENLLQTHAYLQRLRRQVDLRYPQTVLLAEANQWPEEVRAYLGQGDEFHMAFHFPLMPRMFLALARQDPADIVDVLKRTPEIPAGCQWCTFLRNHDELTLEMVSPSDRQFMWDFYAPEARMRLNLGIRRRLAPLLNNDRRKVELLNSLLFTLPGSPTVYYGDEIGMGDDISLPDRDGVRTPMQWTDGAHAGFCPPTVKRAFNPVIDAGPYDYRVVNVEAQLRDENSLLNWMRRLIETRKRLPSLAAGSCELLEPDNPAVMAHVRRHGEEVLVLLHNLSENTQRVLVSMAGWEGRALVDALTGRRYNAGEAPLCEIALEPFGYRWLRAEPSPRASPT
jgi:maltose alpha-D-glucosyltransferase/alpha-amylase